MSKISILNIQKLSKAYDVQGKKLSVLTGIDLDIQKGEFVAIVGSSGCGKSTLLRLIVGLEQDYEGQIRFDGKPVVGPDLQRGIVFQEHRLFPWLNVQKNIGLGLLNSNLSEKEKRDAVRNHIDLVGLQGFETAYPYQLSGGMSQRVAIARALVNRPEILVLDEPFGALDAMTRAHLQQELRRIWQQEGITMILVTHDVEEAVYLADRVVVMEPRPGRIRKIEPVALPHPRERQSQAFNAIKDRVLQELSGYESVDAVDALSPTRAVDPDFNSWQFAV